MIRTITRAAAKAWLPRWRGDFNKGDRGRVLIIAGSRGMAGAAVLTALGAARSGAGLIRLATVKSQQVVAAKRAPLEVTTQALGENPAGRLSGQGVAQAAAALEQFLPTVAAVGPGLGQAPEIKRLARNIMSSGTPLVLDADGLNVFKNHKLQSRRRSPLIITPHPGELSRLLGRSVSRIQADRENSARRAARLFRCVCLLKGRGTLITDGRTVWKNPTGNAAMASGGMGDVLTGVIAALWAQHGGNPGKALASAALGAYLHGAAGDAALKKFDRASLLASDLAGFLSSAFQKLRRSTQS